MAEPQRPIDSSTEVSLKRKSAWADPGCEKIWCPRKVSQGEQKTSYTFELYGTIIWHHWCWTVQLWGCCGEASLEGCDAWGVPVYNGEWCPRCSSMSGGEVCRDFQVDLQMAISGSTKLDSWLVDSCSIMRRLLLLWANTLHGTSCKARMEATPDGRGDSFCMM